MASSIKDGIILACGSEDVTFHFGLTIRVLKKRIRDDYMQRYRLIRHLIRYFFLAWARYPPTRYPKLKRKKDERRKNVWDFNIFSATILLFQVLLFQSILLFKNVLRSKVQGLTNFDRNNFLIVVEKNADIGKSKVIDVAY